MKFDLAHYVQRGPQLRHRRRSGLDPDRRSAHAAHHLRPGRGIHRPLLRGRPHRPAPVARGATTRGDVKAEDREELEKTGDYIVDEKHKTVNLTETGMAKAEKMLAHRLEPGTDGLYDPANMKVLHHVNQALRAHALFHLDVEYMVKDGARRHRRRVHRPADAGPPLERRPAPGGRSQGTQHQPPGSEDRAREPDARHGHLPELLPQVQEAVGHDRHGRHRGAGIRQHLQARRDGHPDQPRHAAQGRARQRLPHREGEVRRDRPRHHREADAGPSGPGRHGLDREVGAAVEAAEAARHQARRPQRQVPRAGSGDRRAGGPQEHRHDRHQHGGPRHRHPARRQPRVHGAPAGAGGSDRREAAQGAGEVRRRRGLRLLLPPRQLLPRAARRSTSASSRPTRRRPTSSTTRSSRWAGCTSSRPSATRRGASTTSCAAAPAARAIPAPRASTSRSKTT